MDSIIDLIGSSHGPGWGTAAAVAWYLIRLHIDYGRVKGLMLAISQCPRNGCPYAAPAAALSVMPDLTKKQN